MDLSFVRSYIMFKSLWEAGEIRIIPSLDIRIVSIWIRITFNVINYSCTTVMEFWKSKYYNGITKQKRLHRIFGIKSQDIITFIETIEEKFHLPFSIFSFITFLYSTGGEFSLWNFKNTVWSRQKIMNLYRSQDREDTFMYIHGVKFVLVKSLLRKLNPVCSFKTVWFSFLHLAFSVV